MTVALRPDPDALRRQELASFLRSRRERLSPDDVGLTTYGRRRTPGLRREEVAQLAGVGITWYTWLEQGRDINVSVQVLEALARTLHFDRHERAHLMALAGAPDSGALTSCPTVTEGVLAVLEQLEPTPAVIHNARRDILAHNRAYERIFPELAQLPPEERNALWLMFTNPAWRASMPDWESAAPRLVAQFRSAMAEHVAEPVWKGLLTRLLDASPEFAEFWERYEVLGPETGCKRYLHVEVGLLRLDFTHLWLDQRLGTRMTVYTPADDATRQALEILAERHGAVGSTGHAGLAQR
ncbi:MAG: family transcriptional regulator [Frankiales bacterium]|nr:family transcriptional regulator [Frankiales bacterium]